MAFTGAGKGLAFLGEVGTSSMVARPLKKLTVAALRSMFTDDGLLKSFAKTSRTPLLDTVERQQSITQRRGELGISQPDERYETAGDVASWLGLAVPAYNVAGAAFKGAGKLVPQGRKECWKGCSQRLLRIYLQQGPRAA